MHFVSHIGQDRWVAETLKYKRCGFFLDFGAFDGLVTSNTFFLERFMGWRGILVEPNPVPYASACAVRSCISVNAALWPEGRLALQFVDAHGLSSLARFADTDDNAPLRRSLCKGTLTVDTINPTDLLDRFGAPNYIDYMSLDVEGAEYEVLSSIDLVKYQIALMTVEHNHIAEKQRAVRELLSSFGYEVVEHRNDDFFFNRSHLEGRYRDDFDDPVRVHERVLAEYRIGEANLPQFV